MSDPTETQLLDLHAACTKAAHKSFRMHSSYWLGDGEEELLSPLAGHCSIVALMIRGMFGGCIVTGCVDGTRHFWNRLPSGREIDLTSCQFGGNGIKPLKRGRKVRDQDFAWQSFVATMFALDVQRHLANNPRRAADEER